MLAYLILAGLTLSPASHNALAVNDDRVPVLAPSKQVNDLLNLRAIFPELRWPPIDTASVKPQSPPKAVPYFETTDFFKVWHFMPPRTSPGAPSLIAQVAKDPLGLSPEDRNRYDEHLATPTAACSLVTSPSALVLPASLSALRS
jgi:hypothetical protein